ncbi:MAG: hypothetical protein OEY41_11340, partial [Acidimicrobiia bacterium]|nr:hypothetical protein [Acidimicrobiia bacterium]
MAADRRHAWSGGRLQGPRRRCVPVVLAIMALLAPACGLLGRGDDAATTDPPATAAPDTASTEGTGAPADPAFKPAPCPFDAPAGTEPRCGTVAVPEDWATGTGT